MNINHSNFGQQIRLTRLAVRLRTFTVAELQELTGISENTIYSFISKLAQRGGYLEWRELKAAGRGRSKKRYSVTEPGLDYLLRENARVIAVLRDEPMRRAGPVAAIPEVSAVAVSR
jgi:predicted ArsR family transcriptional regulator